MFILQKKELTFYKKAEEDEDKYRTIFGIKPMSEIVKQNLINCQNKFSNIFDYMYEDNKLYSANSLKPNVFSQGAQHMDEEFYNSLFKMDSFKNPLFMK